MMWGSHKIKQLNFLMVWLPYIMSRDAIRTFVKSFKIQHLFYEIPILCPKWKPTLYLTHFPTDRQLTETKLFDVSMGKYACFWAHVILPKFESGEADGDNSRLRKREMSKNDMSKRQISGWATGDFDTWRSIQP